MIPKPKYIFNNYEPHYNEAAEEKIMDKAAAIKFGATKHGDSSAKSSEFVINLEEFQTSTVSPGLPLGSTELEFYDDLTEKETEIFDDEENLLKKFSSSTIDMYKIFPSSTIIGTSIVTATQRVSQSTKLMIFEQEGFNPETSEKTNFLYLLGLPYDLTSKSNANIKYEIQEALAHIGEIRSLRLYSYRDFCSINRITDKLLIPKDLTQYFNEPITESGNVQRKNEKTIERTEEFYQPDSLEVQSAEDKAVELQEPNLYSLRRNSIKMPLPVK